MLFNQSSENLKIVKKKKKNQFCSFIFYHDKIVIKMRSKVGPIYNFFDVHLLDLFFEDRNAMVSPNFC